MAMRITRQIAWSYGQKNPENYEILVDFGRDIISNWPEGNFYHQGIADEIEYSIVGRIALWVLEGLLLRVKIGVGCTPYPDKMVLANDAALKHLPEPFNGEFWGGCSGPDGNLEWNEPIRVQRHICSDDGCIDKTEKYHDGLASLEVGYCPASQLIDRLLFINDGVARWPYGEEHILLFVWDMDRKMKEIAPRYPSMRSQAPMQLELWQQLFTGEMFGMSEEGF